MRKTGKSINRPAQPSDEAAWPKRQIVVQMIWDDFKNQYLGSLFGTFWAFIQPLLYVFTLWFVFAVGFRTSRLADDTPFVLWLMPGMFFWFFISVGLQRGAGAILDSRHLVKNVRFRLTLLPVIQIMSALLVHSVFLLLLVILFLLNGLTPTIYWLQTLYYLLAAVLFATGASYIFSSMAVFAKDTLHFLQIALRIGFWFTPVFWNIERMPAKVQTILMANPAYYLIQGYRDSLLNQTAFWERPLLTAYFWVLTISLYLVGLKIFRRLKPHFADML